MAVPNVARRSASSELAGLLDSPEIADLVARLEDLRWTGRRGYPIRSLVGACLVKSLYAIPTWTRTAALIAEHAALRDALGAAPSVYAMYRFAEKLRANRALLDGCLDRVIVALRVRIPEYGRDLAIDASDLPAYANGQRLVSKNGPERERFSDPDASWGHRSAVSTRKGGGFYGYKIHAAVCLETDLPVAWRVVTAREHESNFAIPLIDDARARGVGAEIAVLDKGYDNPVIHREIEARDCRPIIPLRKTPDVKRGEHQAPSCEHGPWRFAGTDYQRKASKWRCPTGECRPASRWVADSRLHPLIPRETLRWKGLYRKRAAVEREFGRLKHNWALLPLRTRGIERVALHADLTVLARLSCALARARGVPAAA